MRADPATGRGVLSVENAGDAPVVLRFGTSQQFDARVLRDGQEVWRWSAGRTFLQVLTELCLQPGERREYAFELPPLPPGAYVLEAGLAARQPALEPARAPLPIP